MKDGAKSTPVEFRVTDMVIRCSKTVCKQGDSLTLTFGTEQGDKALGWIVQSPSHFWRQGGFFSGEERAAGRAEITVDAAPGEYYVFVMAEGAFGRYRSPGFDFVVEE